MLIKCPSCKGAKKVIKLGLMEGDCNTCAGTGVIKQEEPVQPAKDKSKKGKG